MIHPSNFGLRALLIGLLLLAPIGCAGPQPDHDPNGNPPDGDSSEDPVGQRLPEVEAETLAGRTVSVPGELTGAADGPVVLLIGYRQRAQFDIDRWQRALADSEIGAPVYEMLAIPGVVERVFARSIRAELREGTPPERRHEVLTVFADAAKLAGFTGADNPVPARVLLLDPEGRVAFFHDRGYSASALQQLREARRSLRDQDSEKVNGN